MPKEGTFAPNFALADENGSVRSLAEYKGQWILLFFYPKDDTPGCTKEACMLRDSFPRFEGVSAVVLGVSADSTESHKKFIDKYRLPFSLLADENKEAIEAYGVWGEKNFMGKKYMGTMRTSFLIDPAGKIRKVYEHVKPEAHAEEVLKDLAEFGV